MSLSAPTNIAFIISIVIVTIGLLAGLGAISFLPISAFWTVVIGYLVLVAGNLLTGF